jgi:hypothetical protein
MQNEEFKIMKGVDKRYKHSLENSGSMKTEGSGISDHSAFFILHSSFSS